MSQCFNHQENIITIVQVWSINKENDPLFPRDLATHKLFQSDQNIFIESGEKKETLLYSVTC